MAPGRDAVALIDGYQIEQASSVQFPELGHEPLGCDQLRSDVEKLGFRSAGCQVVVDLWNRTLRFCCSRKVVNATFLSEDEDDWKNKKVKAVLH